MTGKRQPSSLLVLGLLAILVVGCRSEPVPSPLTFQATRLQGMTRDQIVACAGEPVEAIERPAGIELRYYHVAPILERSEVLSKGSRHGAADACWVRLLFEQDRVVGVEYVPVPLEAPDVYCETILESCLSGQ